MAKAFDWDGNPKKMPEKGRDFIFKGRWYKWRNCPCGCGYAHATDANGEDSFEVTTRLRGKDQGHPMANILLKLVGMEKLVETEGDREKALKLLLQTLLTIKKESKSKGKTAEAYIESKGVSPEDLNDAIDSVSTTIVVITPGDIEVGPWM